MKKIKGGDYVVKDEKYDKKMLRKDWQSMKKPGIATALKISAKETGYSKMPKVKPQKKNAQIVK
jgi:hypothetical protein